LYGLTENGWPVIKSDDLKTKSKDDMLWGATIYGPYYVDEYVSGDHVTLKKNPYYKTNNKNLDNKGPANVDTITVRFMTDPFAVLQGVLSGEIAAANTLSADQLTQLSANPDITIDWEKATYVYRFSMNNNNALFKDPDVRLAMSLLINREKLSEYSNGSFDPVYAYVVPGMTDYSPAAEEYFKSKYVNDVERAKKILVDKGWKDTDGDGYLELNGKKFEFTVSYWWSDMKGLSEYMQILFKEAGIKMNLNYVEWSTFDAQEKSGKYDADINYFGYPETSGTLPYIVTDPKTPIDLTLYNKIIKDASVNVDEKARMEGYTKAQEMLMDSLCDSPLARQNKLIVHNKKLAPGIKVRNFAYFLCNDIK
jgi:peptide/nickel transport system substrate-binding protein